MYTFCIALFRVKLVHQRDRGINDNAPTTERKTVQGIYNKQVDFTRSMRLPKQSKPLTCRSGFQMTCYPLAECTPP